NTLLINGTAEAGTSVEVFKDGSSIGTTTAASDGTWSFDYTGTTLADGTYQFTAQATDLAGNTGDAPAKFAVTLDTSAPSAQAVPGTPPDTGSSPTGRATDHTTLLINGTAEAGSSVEVFKDGTSIGTTTAASDGTWSFDYTGTTLADGTYQFTAQATDLA